MSPCRKADSIVLEAALTHGHEKPCRDDILGPYRNPTQVSEVSIQRRSGELS